MVFENGGVYEAFYALLMVPQPSLGAYTIKLSIVVINIAAL
jgi:hypothetical protein